MLFKFIIQIILKLSPSDGAISHRTKTFICRNIWSKCFLLHQRMCYISSDHSRLKLTQLIFAQARFLPHTASIRISQVGADGFLLQDFSAPLCGFSFQLAQMQKRFLCSFIPCVCVASRRNYCDRSHHMLPSLPFPSDDLGLQRSTVALRSMSS